MKQEYGHILLENSDIGFPRLTTLRRRLEEYEGFATEIYQKLMKEYGFVNYPPLYLKYMIHPTAGSCGRSFFEPINDKKIAECHIRINITNARLYDERVYCETVPHEVAHIFQGLVDYSLWEKDGHGNFFFECADIIKGYFPYVEISQSFSLDFEKFKAETLADCKNFNVGKLQ